jgi:hypothetical protein
VLCVVTCNLSMNCPLCNTQSLLFLDGRCHRHGQTNAVYVKCYYVPMSMESRLLDQRKRVNKNSGRTQNMDQQKTPFTSLYGDDSDDEAELGH